MNKRLGASILLVVMLFVALAQSAAAGPRDQPPPLPGWTHSPRYSDDTPGQHGLPLSGAPITFGSPVIADLDGNANNGSEVVVGGRDGRLYARRANGSSLWEQTVPNAGCSTETLIFGKPTVGAINGDGVAYVAVGYGSRNGADSACDGGVVVYRGSDGQQLWNFSQRAFDAQTPEGPENNYGVITAVAMADADGDGRLELAFGGLDRNLYLLNADGSVRWYYHAADSIWSTPLFMNVDGDPQLELIAGTDISPNGQIIPPTQAGGYVYAFDTAARNPVRIPFQTGFIWRTFFDQVIYSSPLAGDLLSSNGGLEIAVGSGCYWPVGGNPLGAWVKILRPSDGAVLQTLNAPGCVQSSPAAGDIDDDGQLEIVATTRGTDNRGHIVAWDPASPSPKWDRVPGDPNSGSNDANIDLQSPVIADLDGNGSLEVLATNFWSVHVLNGRDGSFLTCQSPSCGATPSLFAWGTLKSTPAVGDVDGDGDLEVLVGGEHVLDPARRGHIYAWTDFRGVLNSPQGGQQAYSAPWPQLRRTATANGVIAEPGLTATATSLNVLAEPGDSRTYTIVIGSADGSPINPRVSVASDLDQIVTPNIQGTTLRLTVNAAGRANGVYQATVNVSSPGLPDLPIQVTLRVLDNVTTVALPMVRR